MVLKGGRLGGLISQPFGGLNDRRILITILVLVLVLYLIKVLPVDGRVKRICQIIVIVIAIIHMLRLILPGFPV